MNKVLRNLLAVIIIIVIASIIAGASSSTTLWDVSNELEVKESRLTLVRESKEKLHHAAESLRYLSFEDDHSTISELQNTWTTLNDEESRLITEIDELKEKKASIEYEIAERERKAAEEKAKGKYLGVFNTTAYCLHGTTSTGVTPRVGVTIAVDPKVIPYGSKLRLVRKDTGEEIGYRIAQDCGGAIKGKRLDIYLSSEKECRQWGRKNLEVYLVED